MRDVPKMKRVVLEYLDNFDEWVPSADGGFKGPCGHSMPHVARTMKQWQFAVDEHNRGLHAKVIPQSATRGAIEIHDEVPPLSEGQVARAKGPDQPVLSNGPNIFWSPIGSADVLNTAEFNVMKKYNLAPVRDSDGKLVFFCCQGCGTEYRTIQDRTLRPVGSEGCPSCLQKIKWG